MAYYPNYFYPTQSNVYPTQMNVAPTQNNVGIIWVQGEAGAKSYLVGAGQSVLLMDAEGSCFYIKSTDASGMPMPLRIFDYKERNQAVSQTPTEYVTRDEFDAFKKSLKEVDDEKSTV